MLEQRHDPAIPITAVLAGKLDDRLRECIFVCLPYRTIALLTARLVSQPASLPLRYPMLLCMICCDMSALGAYKFPEANSFNTRLSTLRFAIRHLSFRFSCSNSFSRFAWSIRNPPYSLRQRKYVCCTITASLHAKGVVFPFAAVTSILPQQFYHLLRLVLLASSHMLSLSSVSLLHWHISGRARQAKGRS